MSKSSYFQDFLLKDQFPVPVTLRTIATTRPPRPRYPPPCLSARVIVPVRIVSPVSLCLHCSLLVLSLCVLWLASPVYNPTDLVSHHHQSISLSVLFSNSIRLTTLPERLTCTSHPRRSRLRSRAITEPS